MLHSHEVAILADASGDAVDYTACRKITGKVVAIKYEFGTLTAGTDFVIIGETSTSPIFTIANVGAADNFWNPRLLPNQHNDGSAFTDAAGDAPRVFNERIQITTDEGGAAGAGTLTFYVEDDNFVE